jgi:hypothetical protein
MPESINKDDAFCVVHESVAAPPAVMDVGLTDKEHVGTGAAVTVRLTVAGPELACPSFTT